MPWRVLMSMGVCQQLRNSSNPDRLERPNNRKPIRLRHVRCRSAACVPIQTPQFERTLGLSFSDRSGLQIRLLALMCILAIELRNVMERDIKDVIGVLMRVLEGGEISHDELDDLAFEADGELETALNEAYVKLREFANDREPQAGSKHALPATEVSRQYRESLRSGQRNCRLTRLPIFSVILVLPGTGARVLRVS
jgi:hypothetical protein